MPSKSDIASQSDAPAPAHGVPSSTFCSEQWWPGARYDPVASAGMGENDSDSEGNQSASGAAMHAEDDGSKDSQPSGSMQPEGNYVQEHHAHGNYVPPSGLGNGEFLAQPQPLELVSHSIACAPNPYPDFYYGGMMPAYGPQPMVHPQFYGMNQARMALPLEVTQEPVYVNAKQYHGILRRRESRAKAELARKLIKVRKPYLHESRHQHALRRARGSGGRFAKKTETEASNQSADEKNESSDAGNQGDDADSNVQHGNHGDFQHSGEMRAKDGHSNQRWGSNQGSKRALAI